MRLVATPPTPSEITDLLDICSPDDEDGAEHTMSEEDMRQAFLDHALGDYQKRNRFLVGPVVPEQLTAWTSGWAGLGHEGIACLNFE